MGLNTLLGMASKFEAAGVLVNGSLPLKAVEAGTLTAKATLVASLTRAVPSRRLRNVGKNGAALSVASNVVGTENPRGLVHANGPWQLIESDTKAHVIVAKGVGKQLKGRGSGHAKKQVKFNALFGGDQTGVYSGTHPLNTPYGPRYRVNHPGTQGKHPWADGVVAAKLSVPVAMTAVATGSIEALFRG
jgi:hypothetical protein